MKLARRCVALCGLLIITQRLCAMHEPLDVDIMTYATLGHELLHGKKLYVDLFDVKPPGLYWTFAIGEWLAGFGAPAVFILGLAASLATLLGVYLATSAYSIGAGVVAALFWTLMQGSISVQANQPNTEAFMSAGLSLCVALLVKHPGSGVAWLRYVGAGLLLGIASQYKPLPVFPALLFAVANVAFPARGVSRVVALLEGAVMGLAALSVLGVAFGAAFFGGYYQEFVQTQFKMNAGRTTSALLNLYRYLREGHILPLQIWFLIPSIGACCLGFVRGVRGEHRRLWVMFAAWALGVHAMIFMPGSAFHIHALQLWLPVLALGLGYVAAESSWAFAAGGSSVQAARSNSLMLVASFAVAVAHEVPQYFRPLDSWAVSKFGSAPIQDRALGDTLREILEPGDQVFLLGNGAAPYYYTGRSPTTPTTWSMFLLGGMAADRLRDVTIERLKALPPRYVAIQNPADWAADVNPSTPHGGLAFRFLAGPESIPSNQVSRNKLEIYQWITDHYVLHGAQDSAWSGRYALLRWREDVAPAH